MIGSRLLIGILASALIFSAVPAWSRSEAPTQFRPDSKDKSYYVLVVDNSPYSLKFLPQTEQAMEQAGFEKALGPSSADVQITIFFRGGAVSRPGEQAAQGFAGALLGAALGAAIGAAAGDPGAGAAIGAIAGGMNGLATPTYAGEGLEVKFKLENKRRESGFIANLDLNGINPYDYRDYIDNQVANLLYGIMKR